MCGLCGNYDGIKENDLVDREGNTVVPDEVQVTNKKGKTKTKYHYTQLGNSWQVETPDDEQGWVYVAGGDT